MFQYMYILYKKESILLVLACMKEEKFEINNIEPIIFIPLPGHSGRAKESSPGILRS